MTHKFIEFFRVRKGICFQICFLFSALTNLYGQDSTRNFEQPIFIDSTDLVMMCLGNVGTVFYREYFDSKNNNEYFVRLKDYHSNVLAAGYILRKNDRKCTLSGEWKFYYKTGIIRRSGYYKNNLKDGDWYDYDENEKIINQVYYIEEDKEENEFITISIFDNRYRINIREVFSQCKIPSLK